MVMLVSSVWHGVHPGYYLSLGSVPFCLMVSLNNVISKPIREAFIKKKKKNCNKCYNRGGGGVSGTKCKKFKNWV